MSGLAERLGQALALLEASRSQEAAAALESICRMQPVGAADCFAQGVALHWLGRLEPALAAFDRTLDLDPRHVDALNGRGAVLLALGRVADADVCYRRALDLVPGSAQVLANLAIVLEAQSSFDEASARYREALAADPDCRPALLNLGALLLRLGRPREAYPVARRLVDGCPDSAEAHLNFAVTLLALDRYAPAREAAEKALGLLPTSVAARITQAVALACQGEFDAALASFRLARATDPALFAQSMQTVWAHGDRERANWPRGQDALPDPRVLYLARGINRLARCDWSDRDAFLGHMHRIVRESEARGVPVCEWSLPFASTWLPLDEDVRRSVATAVGSTIERLAAVERLTPPSRGTRRPARLHVGYITPDAREHPNVTLTAPMIAGHDRKRFRITGYLLGRPDTHPMAREFRASCEHVRECGGRSDTEVARSIRDDGVDILVDLAGYTDGARPEVAALRPARIHCTYLGYPGTMGATWCDYRISDPVATPASTQHAWAERLALLPRSMFACEPVPLPDAMPDRRAENLPPGFVFCAFHTANKIDPTVFAVWLRLLQGVPGSVLWLGANGDAADNLQAEAIRQGIDPKRLVFAERQPRREDHLGRLRLADLYLDTPCYNAHTTAVEALHAGVPVLTCARPGPASSVGASVVREAGLDALVVPDLEAYEARALALAQSPHALRDIRRAWERRRSACRLFDPRDLASEIERAYDHMWLQHAAGKAPQAFQLERVQP